MVNPTFRIATWRTHVLQFVAFAYALSAYCGCTTTTDGGEFAPSPTGTLSGLVMLYDGAGNLLTMDTGVTVTASQANMSSPAITNDSGRWMFTKIFTGTYTLAFTKSGFGTVEQFSDTVTANDTTRVPTVLMSQAPTLSVGFNDYEIIAPSTLSFVCTMPKGENLSVVFCLSTDSASLASDPSSAEWTFLTTGSGDSYGGNFQVSSDSTFSVDSIAHGTVIYATVCVAGEGTNYGSFSSYYDPVAKREVYSALGMHSGIISKTIP